MPGLVLFLILGWGFLSPSPSSSQTPPTNKYNCSLNSSNPFSYVVQIWDLRKSYNPDKVIRPGTAAWGALITYKAALSSARYYHRAEKEAEIFPYSFQRYRAIAQNIWEWTPAGRMNPCYQERRVFRIYYHPRSDARGFRLFFDYSVVLLDKPFVIATNTSYPTMPFLHSPFALLLAVRFVNTHERAYCEMPVPISSEPGNRSVINSRIEVSSIKFHQKCIHYICEQNPTDSSYSNCKRTFRQRLNGTILCLLPGWTNTFDVNEVPDFPNSYAGIPLVCNSSVLGLSPHIKRRGSFKYSDFPRDFFYVITLLRIWRWLSTMIVVYKLPPQPFYMYNLTSTRFTEPSRASRPDYGKSSYFGLYDDVNPEPHQRNTHSGSSAIFAESKRVEFRLLPSKSVHATPILLLIDILRMHF